MMQRDTKTSMSPTGETEKVWPTKAGFEQNSTASWQDQRQYGWMHEDEFSLTAARLLIGF